MATYWENSCSFGLRYVSWYKYLIVSLVFSHLGFWSGNLFLIAPFPDLCLLVPFHTMLLRMLHEGLTMASRWPDDIVLSAKCIPDCVPKASHETGIYYRLRFIFLIYFWPHLDNISLCIDYPVESCKISVILFGSMLPYLKGN